MPLTQAKCMNCGAKLKVFTENKVGICENCGSEFLVEDVINNYNTNISANNINIEKAEIVSANIKSLEKQMQRYINEYDFLKAYEYANKILDNDSENKLANNFLNSYYNIYDVKVSLKTIIEIENMIKNKDDENIIISRLMSVLFKNYSTTKPYIKKNICIKVTSTWMCENIGVVLKKYCNKKLSESIKLENKSVNRIITLFILAFGLLIISLLILLI